MTRRLMLICIGLLICAHGSLAPVLAKHPARETAGPSEILIIRHGEKPDGASAASADLSPRGFERAEALAKVIPERFGKVDFLCATKRSKKSNRPVETITPLSKAIHEEIDARFADDEFESLAHALLTDPKYAGKVVLIAWHHGKIPQLAHALGAKDAPDKWNSESFDRVWKITFENGVASFSNVPENSLLGDSN